MPDKVETIAPPRRTAERVRFAALLLLGAALYVVCLRTAQIDLGKLWTGLPRLAELGSTLVAARYQRVRHVTRQSGRNRRHGDRRDLIWRHVGSAAMPPCGTQSFATLVGLPKRSRHSQCAARNRQFHLCFDLRCSCGTGTLRGCARSCASFRRIDCEALGRDARDGRGRPDRSRYDDRCQLA